MLAKLCMMQTGREREGSVQQGNPDLETFRDPGTIIRITIDKVVRDRITDKIPNGLLETEVKVGIEMKTTIMIIQEVGVEIDIIIDLFNTEEKNLGPNLTPGSILIVIK